MRRLKKFLVAIALFLGVATLSANITDSFTGSNGASIGTGWTQVTGTWVIQTNRASTSLFTTAIAIRSELSFPDNQFAQALIEGKTTDAPYDCVVVRGNGTTYYSACVNSAGTIDGTIQRVVGGVSTYLVQYSTGVAVDTTMTFKLTISGQNTATTLRMSVNGSNIGSDYVDNSGSAINSGKPGISIITNGAMPILDDFVSTDANVTSSHTRLIGGGLL